MDPAGLNSGSLSLVTQCFYHPAPPENLALPGGHPTAGLWELDEQERATGHRWWEAVEDTWCWEGSFPKETGLTDLEGILYFIIPLCLSLKTKKRVISAISVSLMHPYNLYKK